MSEPFPDNILSLIESKLVLIDGVNVVLDRPLGPTDANGALGLWYEDWEGKSMEMMGGGFHPTLGEHLIGLEHIVKHTDRAGGARDSRNTARRIRRMLYADPSFQVSLGQLVHTDEEGTVERFQSLSLKQAFGNMEASPGFLFVSTTSLTITTETIVA